MLCVCLALPAKAAMAVLQVHPGVGDTFIQVQVQVRDARIDRNQLRLTFEDRFASLSVSAGPRRANDPRAWRSTYFWGDRVLPNNREAQYYVDDGPDGPFIRHPGGGISILARPLRQGEAAPAGTTHLSGLLNGQHLIAQLYGHFEIRARVPRGRGFWSAYWLLPIDGGWPPEIDAMEVLGHDPHQLVVSVHATENAQRLLLNHAWRGHDLSQGFHTFGVSWRPDVIRFYLDDAEIFTMPTPPSLRRRPMYPLVNLAVGGPGSWPGPAVPGSSGQLDIEWIRVWQFTDLPAPGSE